MDCGAWWLDDKRTQMVMRLRGNEYTLTVDDAAELLFHVHEVFKYEAAESLSDDYLGLPAAQPTLTGSLLTLLGIKKDQPTIRRRV